MIARVLASGSDGNCTAITSAGKLILIDCGMPFRWTLERLNYELPDALLVTHEHCDHAKTAEKFLRRGVNVFMTAGTAAALKLSRYNLQEIAAGETFQAASVTVTAIPSQHDAAEPVNFILQDETDRLLFVTDTGTPPIVEGNFTQIFIEANYSEALLLSAPTDDYQKRRVRERHLSIEQTTEFLTNYPQSLVTLIHISKRHGDREEFYQRVFPHIKESSQ